MRSDAKVRWAGTVVLVAAVLAVVPTAPSFAAGRAKGCGSWKVVPSPNVGSEPSLLNAVAALSPSEAYAVGNRFDPDTGVYHSLIERWNGSAWKVASSPDPGDATNSLGSVAAVGPGEAWAVGTTVSDGSGFRTLTEHLSGGAWSAVQSPNPGDQESQLLGVTVVAAGDVWAVGFQADAGGPRRTLIEHWDGSRWKAVKAPSQGTDDNLLYAVTAVAPDDVWAVGAYSVPWFQTLVLHWNGTKWRIVKSPNVGDGDNLLYDVTPTGAPDELRAVGSSFDAQGNTVPLALRWNGSKWKVTPAPGPVPGFDALFGVAASAPDDIRAVGDQGGFGAPFRTLAEHWGGSSWALETTPNVGTNDNHLYDITEVPGTGDLWAVGTYVKPGVGERTLIERLC